MKNIRTRLLIILGVTLFSIYLFAGFPPSLAKMKERIRLGLDLQGGTHLVLQVVTDDAIRLNTDDAVDGFQRALQENNILVRQVNRTADNEFQAVGVDPAKDAEVRRIITDLYSDWDLVGTAGEVPNTYTLRLKPNVAEVLRDQSVDQAIQTIRNRVDAIGVAEPVIQRRGGAGVHQILVQLPGMSDPARVKNIIKSTALLYIRLVDSSGHSSQAAAIQHYGGLLPANLEVFPYSERGVGTTGTTYVVVQRSGGISGRELRSASLTRDENGKPAVGFTLTPEGASRFARLTGDNIGKSLAIILDGRVQSVATIQDRISNTGIINGGAGGFAPQEAQDLVLVLRSGALPASMTYDEERVVDASLGADSIRQGLIASIAALIGVVVFMLFYYRWAGLNAAVSMALNLIILFAALAYFQATLTLPGIAGVILTIGVGIDSNVLIFERIREELKAGKTAVASITTGFKRVFTTIVDTHLAALISAMFLFLFGTGPVKGFAVTLVIGLAANVFTAVFVSRTLFDWTMSRRTAGASMSI